MKKTKLISFLAGCLCLAGAVSISAQEKQANALPVEDILRARSFGPLSSIEFSPDGKWLAYGVEGYQSASSNENNADLRNAASGLVMGEDVWLLNTATGDAINLTNGEGKNWDPTWSPDGHFLAFLSDREGSGRAQISIWDATNNDLKKPSDMNAEMGAGTRRPMEWAPDSRRIFVPIKPGQLSTGVAKRNHCDREEDKTAGDTEQAPTVRLYRSCAIGKGKKEAPKSDPWDLDIGLRDLACLDIVTGQTKVVVHGQRIQTLKIAPDGSRVAYSIAKRFEKPGTQDILYDLTTMTIATGEERVVASGIRIDDWGTAFSWSPDSTLISYHASSSFDNEHDFYVVDASGGLPRNLTKFLPYQQPHLGYTSVPLWDKSGNYIYFVDDGALWLASVHQGKPSQVARIPDHQVNSKLIAQSNSLLWTVDGGSSTIIVAHDDVAKQDGFYKINLANGETTKLLENGQCFSCTTMEQPIAVTRDGRKVAYAAEDAQHGTNLWLSDWAFRGPRRITILNPQFDKYKFGAARLIDWLSDDGERLHGALLLPPDYQEGNRYPLVVWVYGGKSLSNSFDHFGFDVGMNFQLLATRGYAVLLPDSPSHEGTPMTDLAKTILPGVNKVVEMGIADPERLGVAGHSNGGYSTLALIVQTKRFKAAIDVDGPGDLIGFHGAMGKDGSAFGVSVVEQSQDIMGGTPWEFRDRYIENSPYFYLDRVETPLLIMHVAGDPAVPSFLGDQIFVSLRRLGKEVEYAKYDGVAHAPSALGFANHVDYITRMLTWFDRYLRPSANPKIQMN
jgi:dipeptidyl aminopeptidase/acylaminoacyl peptidase